MGAVAARDTWNYTIEESDADALAHILSLHGGYQAGNVKKAVIQRALTRLGMRVWLENQAIDLASLLPPQVPPRPKAGEVIKHPAVKDDTNTVGKNEKELGQQGRVPGDKGTRKSGDPRQSKGKKAPKDRRVVGEDTAEERREREGR